MKLSIDVGGTFTDLVLVDEATGKMHVDKVPSTPGSGDAVLHGVARICSQAGVTPTQLDMLFHGFTIATNAWLTRNGARVVLLVTDGFKDILALGSQRRPATYDLAAAKPEPLVPRSRVLEAIERVDAFGQIVTPLSDEEEVRLLDAVASLEPEAIAVSFLFSWANPAHEEQLARALAGRFPDIPIYTSSTLNPQVEEYPRANTTTAAAYIGPPVRQYTRSLEASLAEAGIEAPLRYMRSDGGAATPASARENPANMLLSGPAGGVVAGLALGAQLGVGNLVTFDMGGTSADFAVIRDGEAGIGRSRDFDGLPLRVPMLDIKAISAGGGSIGWVDRAGALRVGPDSAGATPGPACYGQGGQDATLTDAALTLGMLDASVFAGGDLTLDESLAREAVRRNLGEPLSLEPEEAALGMIGVATANMAQAIRELSTERGDDVAEFSLLSFGGAGGLFAPFLLRELGLGAALIPRHPGVFAALGLHYADLRHHAQASFAATLRQLDVEAMRQRLEMLQASLVDALSRDGVAASGRQLQFSADMRYVGQHHELDVTMPAPSALGADSEGRIAADFHALHEMRYGYCHTDSPVEITNLHGVGVGLQDKPAVQRVEAGPAPMAHASRRAPLGLEFAWVDTPLYHRDTLGAGACLVGPAMVIQDDSTLVVLSGQRLHADEFGFIHLIDGDK